MHTDSGLITIVQEERFQLMNDAGVHHLYLLPADTPVGVEDLERLQRSGERVRVRYRDAPDSIARIAQELSVPT